MGKASRTKHLKRQKAAVLQQYGGVKLSEALINLCEPYDHDLPLHGYKNLMAAAAVAWNIALQPKEKRHEMLLDALNNLPSAQNKFADDLSEYISNSNPENMPSSVVYFNLLIWLIQRKDELYPNDNRVVVDYAITETGTERNITVSSALP
ncbi:hypothetical protein [Methylotuvimicrobium sp. KM2]|jgi:hypothetical protein|uniref:hypothetical protein n=1 Tax=Methylotuvimicrobium sp. KM2 TaxID=3133976 RepID=UPI0031011EC4